MEDRPARIEDLRALRRWLLVAAVWATAATAIAVISLLAANDAREDNTEAGRQSARTAGQINDAQRRLDRRLEQLERRLGELPTAQDVAELSDRLETIEGAESPTADRLEELSSSIEDLETRVDALEGAPADPAAGAAAAP